ncbi:MAG: hypothetical protein R6V50_05120 [Thermoplasmatota archaeon]
MHIRLKKIDAIIVVALLISSGLFLFRAGYIDEFFFSDPAPPQDDIKNETIIEEIITPPTSFVPSFRRAVSPQDEGVHYDKIRIAREWWYFGAIFNNEDSELKGWGVQIGFHHMARGDLIGTAKPDLFVVNLFSPDGKHYGGMINKERYLGILNTGTLIASSPGVNVQFENSWAEGIYPNWRVHANSNSIDPNHNIIIDLEYTTESLPIWTIGSRAFDQSKSSIANYLFIACQVSGTIKIDGREYTVKGTGHHEHSWTPKAITLGTINGWDWFHFTLDNGWIIYSTTYHPIPQAVTSKIPEITPLSMVLISTDNGETFTELRNIEMLITRQDEQIFPFVKMPTDFSITAKPSINPIYVVSQSLLFGTNLELNIEISVKNSYDKIWRFPTYLGMKTGYCEVEGHLSWIDDDGDHSIPISGTGISYSMRALL